MVPQLWLFIDKNLPTVFTPLLQYKDIFILLKVSFPLTYNTGEHTV